jgi:hypothetical protein
MKTAPEAGAETEMSHIENSFCWIPFRARVVASDLRRPGFRGRVIGFYNKQGKTRPVTATNAPRARLPRPTRADQVCSSGPEEKQQQGTHLKNSETFDEKTGRWIDSSFRVLARENAEDKEPPLTSEFQVLKEKLTAREREKESDEEEENRQSTTARAEINWALP